MTDATTRPERLRGPRIDPNGEKFTWGPVNKIHEIGPYSIVEYRFDMSNFSTLDYSKHGQVRYDSYIQNDVTGRWESTSMSAPSLDGALAVVIAYRTEGANSQAGYYFLRMLGLETE